MSGNILAFPPIPAVLNLILPAVTICSGVHSDSLLAGSTPGRPADADRNGAALTSFAVDVLPAACRPNRAAMAAVAATFMGPVSTGLPSGSHRPGLASPRQGAAW